MDLLEALQQEGVDVRPESDWRTRTRSGTFAPLGIMIHHTVGIGDGTFRVVKNGRQGLPGPLAHLLPRKDGRVHLISQGVCNHAGRGNKGVQTLTERGLPPPGNATTAGSIFGNRTYYGIEIENRGTRSDPYPEVQMDATVRSAAAICRMHGWTADRIVAHKEWTNRKIDPIFDMNEFRAKVAAQLGHGVNPEEDGMKIGDDTSGDPAGGDVARLQDMLKQVTAAQFNGQTTGKYTKATENAVRRYQEHIGLSPTGIANSLTLAVLATERRI